MNRFLWGVYPYVCATLFFIVPVIRMATRPFSWSTRASGMFNRQTLGVASLLFHWGILLVLLGHLAGLFGGLLGSEASIQFFYWSALIGGFGVLLGSGIALYRRLAVPEVRAMSQADDYVVHLLLIPIVALALYQVLALRIFGIAYPASSWLASLWRLSPQPELMGSASILTQLHVFLALTFLGYFPFTKLVHVWTYPVNYFVRPYQSMRTVRYRFQRKWEFALRSDKSWLVYGLGGVALVLGAAGGLLGRASVAGAAAQVGADASPDGRLTGPALYVSQCARCHGVSGKGDGAGAGSPTFAAPPRNLVAGGYRFVSTDNGVASDDDLRRTIARGLPVAGMPGFARLTEAQINSLVQVLGGLWADRPEPGAPIEVSPRPPSATPANGAPIYTAFCGTCHGSQGRGDGVAALAIRDPDGRLVRPSDLAAGRLKAGSEPEQIYLRVAGGIPAGGGAYLMPAFRSALSPEQIWSVVRYVETAFLGRP